MPSMVRISPYVFWRDTSAQILTEGFIRSKVILICWEQREPICSLHDLLPERESPDLCTPGSRTGFETAFAHPICGMDSASAGQGTWSSQWHEPCLCSGNNWEGVRKEENGCASVINLLIVNYPPRHHIMCYLGKNKIA